MYWQCTCGEKFNETGIRDGYSEGITHLWKGRKGEIEGTHKMEGLFRADGELLVAGQNIRNAILKGYIEPADKEKETGSDRDILKSVIKAKTKFLEIELDPELLVLYYLTKGKFPQYTASIGNWLADCIVDYYSEHRELGLDVILANRPEIIENQILKGV